MLGNTLRALVLSWKIGKAGSAHAGNTLIA